MLHIKNFHIADENILFVDSNNYIWIMGANTKYETGYRQNKALKTPVTTNCVLDKNETIVKFHVSGDFSTFYTSTGKLYVSRYLGTKKAIKDNVVLTVDTIARPTRVINDDNDTDDDSDDSDSDYRRPDSSVDDISDLSDDESDRSFKDESNVISDDDSVIEIDFTCKRALEDGLDNYDIELVGDNCKKDLASEPSNNDLDELDELENSDDQDEFDNSESSDSSGSKNEQIQDKSIQSDPTQICGEKITRDSIDEIRCYPCSKEVGFDLLEIDVQDMFCIKSSLFFVKAGQIYLFNRDLLPIEIYNYHGIELKIIGKDFGYYYQLIFPFDYNKYVFMKDYIYMKSGQSHHILSIKDKTDLVWFHFSCDMEIDETNIIYYYRNGCFNVVYNNTIYQYCHIVKELVSIDTFESYIVNDLCGITDLICMFSKDKKLCRYYINLFDGITNIDTIAPNILNTNVIKFYKTFSPNIKYIVIVDTASDQFIYYNNVLYFNVRDVKYYSLINNNIIYYDKSQTLYYCTQNSVTNSQFTLIDSIKLVNNSKKCKTNKEAPMYNIYMINNMPTPVTNIYITNTLILIHSDKKYWYRTISERLEYCGNCNDCTDCIKYSESGKLDVNTFIEIDISIKNLFSNMVKKNLIEKNSKAYMIDEPILFSIEPNTSKFDRFMTIANLIRGRYTFDIDIMDGTKKITYGDGPKVEFLDDAMKEFKDKYLIKNSYSVEYNLKTITMLSDTELLLIGYMIHSALDENYILPIRLPLTLLSEILGKSPTVKQLEYFLLSNDIDVFNHVYKSKDDHDLVLDYGYDNYKECLKHSCKYYHDPDTNILVQKISKAIANGFNEFNKLPNLKKMDIVTLDYVISGDYTIDRTLFINNLLIHTSKKCTITKSNVINALKVMTEEKFLVLLKNWSGTTVYDERQKYIIQFCEIDQEVIIVACNYEIQISETLTNFNNVLDILTDSITSMVDTA